MPWRAGLSTTPCHPQTGSLLRSGRAQWLRSMRRSYLSLSSGLVSLTTAVRGPKAKSWICGRCKWI